MQDERAPAADKTAAAAAADDDADEQLGAVQRTLDKKTTSLRRRVLRGAPMTALFPLCSAWAAHGEATASGACLQPPCKLLPPASRPVVVDGGRSTVVALDAAVADDAYAERPFVAAELEGLPVAVDG